MFLPPEILWLPRISSPRTPPTCQTLYCHVTNISANEEQNGICSIAWIIEVDSVSNLWHKIHPQSLGVTF